MTPSSNSRLSIQATEPAATEADAVASPTDHFSEPPQQTPAPDDEGLATPGEAINGGQAPQVGSAPAETGRHGTP